MAPVPFLANAADRTWAQMVKRRRYLANRLLTNSSSLGCMGQHDMDRGARNRDSFWTEQHWTTLDGQPAQTPPSAPNARMARFFRAICLQASRRANACLTIAGRLRRTGYLC